eukprot:g7491.t1
MGTRATTDEVEEEEFAGLAAVADVACGGGADAAAEVVRSLIADEADGKVEEDEFAVKKRQRSNILTELFQGDEHKKARRRLADGILAAGSIEGFFESLEKAELIQPSVLSEEDEDGNDKFLDSDDEDDVWSENGAGAEEDDEDDSKFIADDPLPVPEGPKPGDKGFNKFLQQKMVEDGVLSTSCRGEGIGRNCTETDHPTHGEGQDAQPDPDEASRLDPLLPHQKIVKYVFETGHCPRLLVDHATGSGKTRTQIELLSVDYSRGRAKIVILPKKVHVDNLIKEMLRWDNPYREFFVASHPEFASACGVTTAATTKLQYAAFRDCVGLKGLIANGRIKKGWSKKFFERTGVRPPSAPLRIFNYATAGGSAMGFSKAGVFHKSRVDACLKFKMAGDVYAGKLLILDEAHNLIRPTDERHRVALNRLRDAVANTCAYEYVAGGTSTSGGTRHVEAGTWVYLMTATPVQPGADPRSLLDVVKGLPLSSSTTSDESSSCSKVDTRNDCGFMSTFQQNCGAESKLYPRVIVEDRATSSNIARCAGSIGQGLCRVGVLPVPLVARSLSQYLVKDAEFQLFGGKMSAVVAGGRTTTSGSGRLSNSSKRKLAKLAKWTVCSIAPHCVPRYARNFKYDPAAVTCAAEPPAPPPALAPAGKNIGPASPPTRGALSLLSANAHSYCPKIFRALQILQRAQTKTLVLVARKSGFLAAKAVFEEALGAEKVATSASQSEIAEFNDEERNKRGEQKLVMLATKEDCAEGVEFRCVRDFHILDCPADAAELQQICGRPVRVGSHAALPHEERQVRIFLHLATLPHWGSRKFGAGGGGGGAEGLDETKTSRRSTVRKRALCLAKSKAWRDERLLSGLLEWGRTEEPPEGLVLPHSGVVGRQGRESESEPLAAEDTVDAETVVQLKQSLGARASTQDKLRTVAIDYGIEA